MFLDKKETTIVYLNFVIDLSKYVVNHQLDLNLIKNSIMESINLFYEIENLLISV